VHHIVMFASEAEGARKAVGGDERPALCADTSPSAFHRQLVNRRPRDVTAVVRRRTDRLRRVSSADDV
jgi:hypothetical protein